MASKNRDELSQWRHISVPWQIIHSFNRRHGLQIDMNILLLILILPNWPAPVENKLFRKKRKRRCWLPSLFFRQWKKWRKKITFSHFFSIWKKNRGKKKQLLTFFVLYGKKPREKGILEEHSNEKHGSGNMATGTGQQEPE